MRKVDAYNAIAQQSAGVEIVPMDKSLTLFSGQLVQMLLVVMSYHRSLDGFWSKALTSEQVKESVEVFSNDLNDCLAYVGGMAHSEVFSMAREQLRDCLSREDYFTLVRVVAWLCYQGYKNFLEVGAQENELLQALSDVPAEEIELIWFLANSGGETAIDLIGATDLGLLSENSIYGMLQSLENTISERLVDSAAKVIAALLINFTCVVCADSDRDEALILDRLGRYLEDKLFEELANRMGHFYWLGDTALIWVKVHQLLQAQLFGQGVDTLMQRMIKILPVVDTSYHGEVFNLFMSLDSVMTWQDKLRIWTQVDEEKGSLFSQCVCYVPNECPYMKLLLKEFIEKKRIYDLWGVSNESQVSALSYLVSGVGYVPGGGFDFAEVLSRIFSQQSNDLVKTQTATDKQIEAIWLARVFCRNGKEQQVCASSFTLWLLYLLDKGVEDGDLTFLLQLTTDLMKRFGERIWTDPVECDFQNWNSNLSWGIFQTAGEFSGVHAFYLFLSLAASGKVPLSSIFVDQMMVVAGRVHEMFLSSGRDPYRELWGERNNSTASKLSDDSTIGLSALQLLFLLWRCSDFNRSVTHVLSMVISPNDFSQGYKSASTAMFSIASTVKQMRKQHYSDSHRVSVVGEGCVRRERCMLDAIKLMQSVESLWLNKRASRHNKILDLVLDLFIGEFQKKVKQHQESLLSIMKRQMASGVKVSRARNNQHWVLYEWARQLLLRFYASFGGFPDANEVSVFLHLHTDQDCSSATKISEQCFEVLSEDGQCFMDINYWYVSMRYSCKSVVKVPSSKYELLVFLGDRLWKNNHISARVVKRYLLSMSESTQKDRLLFEAIQPHTKIGLFFSKYPGMRIHFFNSWLASGCEKTKSDKATVVKGVLRVVPLSLRLVYINKVLSDTTFLSRILHPEVEMYACKRRVVKEKIRLESLQQAALREQQKSVESSRGRLSL